mgnify:CR=1 FL=1
MIIYINKTNIYQYSSATLTKLSKFCSLMDQMFEERVLLKAEANFCHNTH